MVRNFNAAVAATAGGSCGGIALLKGKNGFSAFDEVTFDIRCCGIESQSKTNIEGGFGTKTKDTFQIEGYISADLVPVPDHE
ncbi:hypothetical protein M8J77_001249 [Diaphorina citri]|nr:hypothetical protein M8J77_001249 [Diaphorina citri]